MANDDTTTGKTQGEQLSEPFPLEMLKRHPTKGLTYVPIPEVVARLNRVLGFGKWATKIMGVHLHGEMETETGTYPKWIVIHINLSGEVDGVPFSYDGFGGQEVKYLSKKGNSALSFGPVDIGDEYKGAASDATKKAAQALGVGLDLAREDDAMHYERALKEVDDPKADMKLMQRIIDHAKTLEGDERKSFIAWWNTTTGDGTRGKKMEGGQVTVKEADAAIQYFEQAGKPLPPAQEAKSAGRGRRQQAAPAEGEGEGEKEPAGEPANA